MAVDWKDLPEGKEKYSAYLCSREWGLLRAAVHERAEGWCERCYIHKINAVHHLTYIRRYKEHLDDLQGICNKCHEATHGITTEEWKDPASGYAILGHILFAIQSMRDQQETAVGYDRFHAAMLWLRERADRESSVDTAAGYYWTVNDLTAQWAKDGNAVETGDGN